MFSHLYCQASLALLRSALQSNKQQGQVLDSPAAAAKARSSANPFNRRSQEKQTALCKVRQRRSKFVTGADRASSSDSGRVLPWFFFYCDFCIKLPHCTCVHCTCVKVHLDAHSKQEPALTLQQHLDLSTEHAFYMYTQCTLCRPVKMMPYNAVQVYCVYCVHSATQ